MKSDLPAPHAWWWESMPISCFNPLPSWSFDDIYFFCSSWAFWRIAAGTAVRLYRSISQRFFCPDVFHSCWLVHIPRKYSSSPSGTLFQRSGRIQAGQSEANETLCWWFLCVECCFEIPKLLGGKFWWFSRTDGNGVKLVRFIQASVWFLPRVKPLLRSICEWCCPRYRRNDHCLTVSHVFDKTTLFDVLSQLNTIKSQREISSVQSINQNKDNWSFFTFGRVFLVWELYLVIVQEVVLTIAVGLCGVLVLSFILLPNPLGCLIVTPNVAMIYVELLALLRVGKVYINVVSAVFDYLHRFSGRLQHAYCYGLFWDKGRRHERQPCEKCSYDYWVFGTCRRCNNVVGSFAPYVCLYSFLSSVFPFIFMYPNSWANAWTCPGSCGALPGWTASPVDIASLRTW